MSAHLHISHRLVTAAALALLVSAALSIACAGAATPRLSLTPASGAAGVTVQVTGAGFAPRADVLFTWDSAATTLPATAASASGGFSATFTVPPLAKPGGHVLTASARTAHASASFQVTQGRATTPTSSATTTTPAPATTTTMRTPPARATPSTPVAPAAHWQPALNTSWQIQYSGVLDTSLNVMLYDLDGFDTAAATVAALHANGQKAACYFSAGSWENWRPDAASYPASVLGAANGWPGEKWLDIRKLDALRPLLDARLDMCKAKGFDAVDPDNLDGYTNTSGFPLTAADQLAFNRYVASAAHARGLAVGLKNDGDQALALAPVFDFAVVEQCFQYEECALYTPFITAGKPVFEIEYDLATSAFCAQANTLNFNALKKNLGLDAARVACR